jgi:hypothetical protein
MRDLPVTPMNTSSTRVHPSFERHSNARFQPRRSRNERVLHQGNGQQLIYEREYKVTFTEELKFGITMLLKTNASVRCRKRA